MDFNPGAPAAGGDRLDISDLIDFVGGSTDLAGVIAGGYVQLVAAGGTSVHIDFDSDGALNGESFSNVATLQSTGVVPTQTFNDPAQVAALADNIIVS